MSCRWAGCVFSCGLYARLRIFGSLREVWIDFWAHFKHDERAGKPSRPSPSPLDALRPGRLDSGGHRGLPDVPLPLAITMTLLAVVVWVLYLRMRPPLTATAAYRRLRRRLGRRGAALPDSAPPLAVRRAAESRYPAAAAPAARVIDFYLRESFGGQALEDEEVEILKAALGEAEKNMRKAG